MWSQRSVISCLQAKLTGDDNDDDDDHVDQVDYDDNNEEGLRVVIVVGF